MIAARSSAAPAPPRILGRLLPVLDQHDAAAAECQQRQDEEQHRDRESGLAAVLDRGEAVLAGLAAGLGGGGGRRRARALLLGGALLVLAQAIRHADAFAGHRQEGLVRGPQERGDFAIGDRESEGRVAVLVAGDEGVDPSTRPHWSSNGPPEWPRAMLAVWSRRVMPLIGRTLEKMPTERVGGSGVI